MKTLKEVLLTLLAMVILGAVIGPLEKSEAQGVAGPEWSAGTCSTAGSWFSYQSYYFLCTTQDGLMVRTPASPEILQKLNNHCAPDGAEFAYDSGVFICKKGMIQRTKAQDQLHGSGMAACPAIGCRQEPFDVPPITWDTKELTGTATLKPCKPPLTPAQEASGLSCAEDNRYIVHHRGCADKTRFYLKSEDGKEHCLDLKRLGQ